MWSWKVRIGLILGVVAVLFGMRLFLELTETRTPGNQAAVKARTRAFFQALRDPRLDGRELNIFLGSSEAEIAFDPWSIDRINNRYGIESYSFNFSMRDSSSHFILYMRRIAAEIRNSGRRPKAIYAHFSVSRITERSYMQQGTLFKLQDVWSVYFSNEMWSKIEIPLLTKSKLWIEKYIFNEHSPDQIPTFFTNHLARNFKPLDKPISRALAIWQEPAFMMKNGQLWTRRGNFYGLIPETAPEVQRIKSMMLEPEEFKRFVEVQTLCCDFMYLKLFEARFRDLTAGLRELAALTDRLYLVDLPESPDVGRGPESMRHRRQIFIRAAREGNAQLLVPPPFAADEFIDPVHLSPAGTAHLSRWLSKLKIDEIEARKPSNTK